MSILELQASAGPKVFYDNSFRVVLETHLHWLRTHPSTRSTMIDVGAGHKNQYDLYGLLVELAVPRELHWITMRLNDLTHPIQFNDEIEQLLIPDQGIISNLAANYLSTKKN